MMRRMCCTGMRAGGTLVSSLGWLGALSFVVSVTLASAALIQPDDFLVAVVLSLSAYSISVAVAFIGGERRGARP